MKKTLIITCIFTTLITLASAPAQAINIWDEQETSTEDMGTISLTASLQDKDILKLTLECKDIIKSVIGIAFHLKYEAAKLKFIKYTPGSFLETGGDPYYLVQNQELNEKIIFGETLRASDSFPSGNGQAAYFYFQIIDPSQFNFEFENGVLSTLDVVRQDLDQINWENLFISKESLKLADINIAINKSKETKKPWFKSPLSIIIFTIFGISSLSTIIIYIRKYRNKKAF